MISQAYAHKVETTLAGFGDRLDMLDRSVKALAAANEGLYAALNAQSVMSSDGVAALYDILIEDMGGHIAALSEAVAEIKPCKTVGTQA